MKSKLACNSSWWLLYNNTKAVLTHSKKYLEILRWKKALSAIHLQDCGLIEFVPREVAAKSTLNLLDMKTQSKREGEVTSSVQINFLLVSPQEMDVESPTFSTFKFKMARKNQTLRAKLGRWAWGTPSRKSHVICSLPRRFGGLETN